MLVNFLQMPRQMAPQIPTGPQDPRQTLLSQLHGVIGPEPVGWWPPAPGWWLLALLIVLSIWAAIYWLLQRHRQNAYRKLALRELKHVRESQLSTVLKCKLLLELLKRTYFCAYPQNKTRVAAVFGPPWFDVLVAAAPSTTRQKFLRNNISSILYGNLGEQEEAKVFLEQLVDFSDSWIRTHQRNLGDHTLPTSTSQNMGGTPC